MSSMGELAFFLGLQVKQKEDGIFISQDKYVAEILKKFDFVSVKTASTPIETQKPLVKDEEASDVGCFQVDPKTSHLSDVKRIFRYLKGKPNGLWNLFLGNAIKATIVATSTTEAEYVAAANCCGQVLWIQNQMLDCVWVQFSLNTRSSIDNEIQSQCAWKIHTDDNVADLLTKAFDVSRFQFLVVTIGMINP
ncbi:putative ribonuclease H-like domain-containing protein [Tanacetum coccineum]